MVHIIKSRRRASEQAVQIAKEHEITQIEPLTVRVPDALRLTGIGRSKLYELIQAGDLAIVKIGSSTLIPVDSLRGLISKNRRPY
jgi:excisionase family DNA binding protein